MALPVHKLGLEIDEKGHIDRPEAEEKKRQKAIEKKAGFTIIRIAPDKENFDIYAEAGRIHTHITESAKKITEESTKNSIIDKVEDLLKAGPNFINTFAVSKFVKNFVRNLLPTI